MKNEIKYRQKFQILRASKHNPPATIIENRRVEYTNEAKILGLKMTKYGINAHIKDRKATTNKNLKKLRKFSKLESKAKLYLYKALIHPILTYPPIPLNTASKTNIQQLQSIQNRALRWVEAHRPPYTNTNTRKMETGGFKCNYF